MHTFLLRTSVMAGDVKVAVMAMTASGSGRLHSVATTIYAYQLQCEVRLNMILPPVVLWNWSVGMM